jgi:hypothetical protein
MVKGRRQCSQHQIFVEMHGTCYSALWFCLDFTKPSATYLDGLSGNPVDLWCPILDHSFGKISADYPMEKGEPR